MREFFGSWTPDVDGLMAIMEVTRTVISGSVAVAFFERNAVWSPGDVDFYCTAGGFNRFTSYVENTLHGILVLDEPEPFYGQGGILHRKRYDVGSQRFDIMRSATPSALYPLAHFHSTLVMTALSPTSLLFAYPLHIINHRGLMMHPIQDLEDDRAITKYKMRGFELVSFLASEAKGMEPSRCLDKLRYFGDDQCLRLDWGRPLVDTKRSSMANSAFGYWSTGWVIGTSPCKATSCEACTSLGPHTTFVRTV